MISPIGRLPTPAEALDAPDWPSTGGYDTQPGARPPVARDFEPARKAPERREPERKPQPEPVAVETRPEPKPDRPSIASFFGFGGTKSEDSGASSTASSANGETTATDSKPDRKGWWQKKS
jgi:hypothetical protein